MTVLVWPTGSFFRKESFMLHPYTNQRVSTAPFGGATGATDLLNDRWLASLTITPSTWAEAARIEAFLNSFRGQTNTVGIWHFIRPQPQGTLRGTPTLQLSAAQFAAQITLTVPSGATLKAGDMLGLGGQLLMVSADCTASGTTLIVPLINRLRTALPPASLVTWDRPMVQFRLVSDPGVQYKPGIAQGLSLDFVEDIAP